MGGDRFLNAPSYGLLQVSTLLKDNAEVGLFASKVLSEGGSFNAGLGLKKKVNSELTVKAKMDKDLKSSVWGSYRLGNGFDLEGTWHRDFKNKNSKKGLLESDCQVGVRLRYTG